MKLSDFTKSYVITSTINISDDGKEFIKFREPNQAELFKFQGVDEKDTKASAEAIKTLFLHCVVDSSFTNDDGTKPTNEELFAALQESGSLYSAVIQGWFETIPFQSRLKNNKKLGK
jgi:hypothetical protein